MGNDNFMYLILLIMLLVIIYLTWRVLGLKSKLEKTLKLQHEAIANKQPSVEAVNDLFFVSEEAKLIFVLLYVDNEERAKLLGITEEMYESIELAKSWKSKIIKVIHPDRCKHPQANEAMSKVNSIYARMKKYAE
ncbi:hypothetical protein [Thiorhodococcus minor]|uniref:J domain-containing protein n=1 Tax=Thiorhodococcus minor TaxID=57489 RepID=A0A6M0K6V1_9GAMM|nr:hypothetical protein [Thiorhodococcus minor]NEV65442.1 hypothetical protein [Thiorhodococcus minor]